jgi:gliding motility-associated-like protein
MRKLYTIKASINRQTSKLMLFAVLLIFSAFNSFSQEIVPFAPRASSANPSTTVYTVKGDFAMIGNTNLTLASYTDTRNNNNDMIYVDVDTDINTWNSSSAYLDFSQENGAVPSCSNIIYAGLYWTGRASNSSSSADIFTVTKNINGTNVTKTFDKRKVSIKGPTSGFYTSVTANSTSLVNKNIYFPSGTEGNMYSAYAEITDYVKANGIGEYFVADIATIEGNGGNTGYYGGWGMVVVYENSQMNWRDVTVFDGHAYVQGSTTIDYTFDVSGFNTAQSGDINLKLGVMAGEGDVGVAGDYFEIQRQDNSQFQRLSHSTNSTTNFFNSSINTGGNARNPNLVNNTGVDISMFSIDNTGNGVITNNQNQTTFRYGSTQDTYVIFNVTFSVDSYVPEVTGVITNTSINGIPNPAPVIIEPGQSAQYKLEIKNAGTEATNNTLVTIPIPDTVDPTNLNFTFNTYYTPDDSSAPLYDSNIGSNGAIIWNLGTLPLPSNPETVLADISFDLTATTDCSSLGDIINTPPSITLFGTISGSGAISNVTFNTPLIQGYLASDICKESPIPIPIIIPIDVTNFSTDPPMIAVPAVLTIEGCDENDITDTTARYIYSATQSADIKSTFVDATAGYTVSNDIASITYIDVITSTSNCALVVTRTYTATNNCGSSADAIQTITVQDTTAPVVTVPAGDLAMECFDATAVAIWAATAFANDNCDGILTVTPTYTAPADDCNQTVTVTFTATDACGNIGTATKDFTVDDETAPVITNSAIDFDVECDGTGNTTELQVWLDTNAGASATDNCGTITWTNDFTALSNECGATGSATVTFTATDDCGNTATTIATFTIKDNTAPTIIAPSDITIQCDQDPDDINNITGTPTGISDTCSTTNVGYNDVITAGNCANNFIITRTWTATDECGNSSSDVQSITVEDTTAPVVTVPAADLAMECFDATAVAIWAATASANDNCDGTLTVTPTYTAPADNCNQTVTVTFTATDACGNIGTATKDFTVDDNTAPVVTVPAADLAMECFDATDVAIWIATASANDNCDGTLTVTPTYTAPADNCNQTVTVTFTATDACGNIGTATKDFTVDDNTAPVVTVPAADLAMECFDATDVAIWIATASANDNCDGTLTVTPTYTAPADNCNQTVTVTFTATDACGNIGTATKDFTVDDNTAPIITCPANITVTADLGQPNANITIALPSVSDNCDANVSYTNDYTGVEDASGIYNLGTTTVTYTATDNCGNSIQCSFTVTVNDEEAPEINCPPTITVSCIDLVPAAYSNYAEFVTAGGTANDNNGIDQATFALVSETSDNNSCPETISRIYTISDTDGNASECTQLIIVNDDINPVLTVPADVTVECDSIPAYGAPTATDNCDADVTITYDGEVRTDGACQDSYTLTRTWTATDNCSNTHTVSQTITVEDTTDPVAPVAPNNISYECIADVPAAGDLTAIDNCAGNITVTGVDNVDNTDPCNVIITRTWTFTDNCTNSSSISQTITVTPVTPPVVPANAGSTVECIADATQPAAPVVTDVCGNDITPVITENADPTCEGDKIYTFTYTDCAGNISVYTYTYTIDVTTAPVVPANAGSTVECIADATQPAAPVVTDVCGNDITPVITENADPTCEGEKIYTFTYTDCAGNISVYTYTYTIDVTTAPVVPTNAGSTVECIADATQPAAPVVTDVCGNDITPVITENADPTCEGEKIYTFTYTDCAGNISVYTYTYTIDLTAFIMPANGLETVDNLADAVEPTPPTVTDNCGNPITPVLSDVSNTPDCQGSIVYTFTYEDCAGNSADWTYTYTVILAPFTLPADEASTVECIADAITPTPPTVFDANGNEVVPVMTENDDPVCEGEKIYTFTYTDCAGNTADWIYTYTIDLTTAPVVPANAGSTVECIADATQPAAPVVTDVCGNDITPVITENADPTCEGDKIYTFTYTDCAGNISVYTYTYTIDVTTAPVVPANAGSTVECIADATQPAAPVVTDVCGNDITPVITENADPTCEGDKIYTFTYTDCAGNISVYTYTYTIDVTTAPVVPANAGSTVECIADATQPAAPVVTDVCGNDITPVITENADPTCEGDKIYTFTYTDCAGNISVYTYTYTIDLTAFIMPVNGLETVDNLADAVEPTPPTVTDNCGNPITPVLSDVSNTPDCQGSIVYTFTYEDCAGNSADWTYTYTVILAPFTLPTDEASTVECIADAITPTPPTVFDANGNEVVPVMTENDDPVCEGEKIYTFTYTDCAGNTADWIYTYTIDLTTAPVVPANAGSTVECIADATQPAAPVVTDVCGNDITPVITENADPTCEGDKIYTFTYTDCAGNISVYTYTYTIDVTTAPVVPANAGSTVECIADATQPAAPVVTDVCGNDITPVITENADPTCEGDKIYTFTYTDCAGNISVYTYTYTIDVTTAPVVPANAGSTVECIADATQPAAPVVTDVCGNDITPVITENADPTCEGEKIYTFTYTDCAGNISVYTYTYTIDVTTAPVVPTNAGSTVECIADATQPAAPVVTDVCGNDITPVITENADPTCEGEKIYTFTYTDCAGNISVYTYTYTIDLTAFIMPANGLETVDNLADAVEPTPPTVTDNCGNPITPVLSDVSNTPDCQGSIVYTFTYEDCAGNSADWTYTYTVILAPFTLPADEASTVECIADAITPTPPTVFDANGNEVVPVMTENDDPVCEGEKIYTFTYTDCAGNTADWIYTYTVRDDIAPIAPDAPANMTFECIDDVPVAGNLTALDNCSGDITVSGVDSFDNSNPCNVIITRTWTFTDDCGNSSSVAHIITVTDTTAPIAPSAPANATFECIENVPVAGNLTASDNCVGDITVGGNDSIDNTNPCNVIITRTWTFTDDCGNSSAVSQTITVIDTTAPVLVSDLDTEISVSCAEIPDVPNLEFEDNCDSNVNIDFSETNTFDESILMDYEIVRTWRVSDACGNANIYTQTLQVSLDEVVTEIIGEDRCFDDGVIDLNDYLQVSNLTGVWEMIEGDTDAILEDNIFDPTVLELSLDFKPGTGGIDYLFKYTTTDSGCISITYVSMNINADCIVLPCGSEDVIISKAITPNGDQYNEYFEIGGVELCGFITEVKIFNRWGALVYESKNYQNNWNGTTTNSGIGNSGTLPNGTYYYIVVLNNSGLNPFTGPVYIGTK